MSCTACSCSALSAVILPLPPSIPPRLEHLVAAGVFHLYGKRLPLHKSLVRQWCQDAVTSREATTSTTTCIVDALMLRISKTLLLMLRKKALRKAEHESVSNRAAAATRRGHAAREKIEMEMRGENNKQTDGDRANTTDTAQTSDLCRFHHEGTVGRLLSIRLALEDARLSENRYNLRDQRIGNAKDDRHHSMRPNGVCFEEIASARRVVLSSTSPPAGSNGKGHEEDEDNQCVAILLLEGKGSDEDPCGTGCGAPLSRQTDGSHQSFVQEGKGVLSSSASLCASDAAVHLQKHNHQQVWNCSTGAPALPDDEPFSCLWFDDSCCCRCLLPSSGGLGDKGTNHESDCCVDHDREKVKTRREKDEEKVKAAEGSSRRKEYALVSNNNDTTGAGGGSLHPSCISRGRGRGGGDYDNTSGICIPIGTMLAPRTKKRDEGSSGGDSEKGQNKDRIIVRSSHTSHVREVIPLLTIPPPPPPLPPLSSVSGIRGAPQTSSSPIDLTTFTQQQEADDAEGGGGATGDDSDAVSNIESSFTSPYSYSPRRPSRSLFPIPCCANPTCHFFCSSLCCCSSLDSATSSASGNTDATDPAAPPLHLTSSSSTSPSPSLPFPSPEFLLAVYNHSLRDVLTFVIERCGRRRRMTNDDDVDVHEVNKEEDQFYTQYWSSFLANYENNGPPQHHSGIQLHRRLRPKVQLKTANKKSEERNNTNNIKTRAATTTTACSTSMQGVMSGVAHVLVGKEREEEEEEEVTNSEQTAAVAVAVAGKRSFIRFDEETKEATPVIRRARKASGYGDGSGGESYSGESVRKGRKRERERGGKGETERRGNEGHRHALVENGDTTRRTGAQPRKEDGQPVIILVTQPTMNTLAKLEIDDGDDCTRYDAQKASEIGNRFGTKAQPARARDHTSFASIGLRSEKTSASTSTATTAGPIIRTSNTTSRNDNASRRICVSLDNDDDVEIRDTHDGASKHKTNTINKDTHKNTYNVGREEKSDDDDDVLLID